MKNKKIKKMIKKQMKKIQSARMDIATGSQIDTPPRLKRATIASIFDYL